MQTSFGERHAALLDEGVNLIDIFPPDHLVGISSSYFGDGGGMLTLDLSPYLENQQAARLRVLGAVAGMGTYADENRFTFALSNNISSPKGTHVHLHEQPHKTRALPYQLPDGAAEVCADISDFIRTTEGNLWSAGIRFDTDEPNTIDTKVSGVFVCDDMYEAYLKSIGRGIILAEDQRPAAGKAAASVQHTILTPTSGQLISFTMTDHRAAAYADEAAQAWRALRSRPTDPQ